MEEYLTVQDFAKVAKVSRQALYSAMKGRLKTYIKIINGKKMIDSRALQDFYGISGKEEKTVPPAKEPDKPLQRMASLESQVEQGIQADYIAFLKSQIAEKDELIKSQQMTIQSLTDRLHEGNVLTGQSIARIETAHAAVDLETMQEDEFVVASEVVPETKKTKPERGWLARMEKSVRDGSIAKDNIGAVMDFIMGTDSK